MTFRFCDAEIIVGANVGASSGSTSSAAIGCTARARSTTDVAGGTSPSTVRRNASTSCCSCGSGPVRREPLDEPRRLHERVVGDARHRRVPRAPVHAHVERRRHLLGGRAEVVDAAAEVEPVAGALVDRVVAAHGVGVLLAEPLQAEAVADLLVGGRREDQVAGRPEALAGERGDRDGVRRHLALHVERAAPPDFPVRAPRPRTAAPTTRADRRGRRRCARAGAARARRRCRGSARRGSPARARGRRARTRRRSPRGTRAGAPRPPSRCPAGSSCRSG